MILELGAACLIGFATITGADPDVLMAATYRQLLLTLGGPKLSAESIKKMKRAKNPFAIPEQEGADLSSLASRLRDFEKLVEAKEWNSPAARKRLLKELDTLAAESERAREKKEEAARPPTFPSYRLNNGYQKFLIPPEGGYVLALGGDSGAIEPVVRVDTGTGKTSLSNGGFEYRPWGMKFSPDGKEVIIGRKDWKVQRVPWRDGKLQWKESTMLEATQKDETRRGIDVVNQTFFDTTGTKLIVARTNYKFDTPEFLFDLTTGQSTKLQVDHKVFDTRGRASQHQWGQIPGTDRFFLVRAGKKAGQLQISQHTYKPDGKVEVVDKGTDFDAARPDPSAGTPTTGLVTWHPNNGKSFVVKGERTVTYHEELTAKAVTVFDTGETGAEVSAVAFHPNGNEVVVVAEARFKAVVTKVNLTTGDKVWTEIRDYGADDVRVLPDGVILVESTLKNVFVPPEALIP